MLDEFNRFRINLFDGRCRNHVRKFNRYAVGTPWGNSHQTQTGIELALLVAELMPSVRTFNALISANNLVFWASNLIFFIACSDSLSSNSFEIRASLLSSKEFSFA